MRTILDYIGLGTIFALLTLGVVLIIAWVKLALEIGMEKARKYLADINDSGN